MRSNLLRVDRNFLLDICINIYTTEFGLPKWSKYHTSQQYISMICIKHKEKFQLLSKLKDYSIMDLSENVQAK
jgi:hypothetical protein